MNIFERIRASESIRMRILGDNPLSAFQTITTWQSHAGRWHSLRSRLAGRGLLATILTVGSLNLAVKIVAAGKEIVVARQLGVGDALDAFLVAYMLPAIAMNVIATSFTAALIPTYIQVREHRGKEAAQRLFSNVIFSGIGLLLLASISLLLLFPIILPSLASGFNFEKLALTRLLFWILVPLITITGIATTWGAVLNAEGDFMWPAITPIVTSILVAFILLTRGQTSGILNLAVGTVAGAGLEMGVLGLRLRRRGISLIPHWQGLDNDLKQIIHQYAPLAMAALVFGGTTLVDQAVAAKLGSGSVAALNYGNKIVALIIGVVSAAVSTSVLPHFSRLVAIGDWNRLRANLRSYAAIILLSLIPLATLLFCFSEPLVRFIFERGAFTAQNAQTVGRIQACFALQIPFYTLGLMCLRLISALKINQHILMIAFTNVVFNCILDLLFAKYLGVAGIALSTSFVSIISCGALYLFLMHAIPAFMTQDNNSKKNNE